MKYNFIDYLKESDTFYADWVSYKTPRWRGFMYQQIFPIFLLLLYITGMIPILFQDALIESSFIIIFGFIYIYSVYKFILNYFKRKKEVFKKR